MRHRPGSGTSYLEIEEDSSDFRSILTTHDMSGGGVVGMTKYTNKHSIQNCLCQTCPVMVVK